MKSFLLLPLLLAAVPLPSDPGIASSASAGTTTTMRADHDWTVDATHSSVVFRVMHANISHFYGVFREIGGTVTLDPEAPEKGAVSLSIPVESIDTRDAKRDTHLKGPDFFNSKENPTITFVSTKIAKKGTGLEVTGDLAMAGTKQSITMLVDRTGEGDFFGPRVGYEATFSIKRSAFGMNYGVAKNQLGDDVSLMIGLELVKPNK